MTDRERAFERIEKLLALAESPNANEASTATRIAESLMAKHGLTRAEVKSRAKSGFYELPMGSKGFEAVWKFALVTATARYCGCEAISLKTGARHKVRLVGERENVERAAALFESLLVSLRDLEKLEASWLSEPSVLVYTTPKAYADSFRRGATVAIIELMMQRQPESFGRKRRKGRGCEASSTGAAREATSSSAESESTGRSTKRGFFSGRWPWKKKVPERAVFPVGTEHERVVSLVVVSKPSGSEQHREKVKAKYAPHKVSLDLENADDDGAYCRGYQSARRLVILPPSDKTYSEDPPTPTTDGAKTKSSS